MGKSPSKVLEKCTFWHDEGSRNGWSNVVFSWNVTWGLFCVRRGRKASCNFMARLKTFTWLQCLDRSDRRGHPISSHAECAMYLDWVLTAAACVWFHPIILLLVLCCRIWTAHSVNVLQVVNADLKACSVAAKLVHVSDTPLETLP